MKAAFLFGIALLASAVGVQDPLGAAKDLYATAAYEDALSALNRVDGSALPADAARQVDEYRAFCLFALGRNGEAESAAEAMIRKDPLAPLDAADAAPRIVAMFAEVRKRLLPSLVRERLLAARSAIDQNRFSSAESLLIGIELMTAEAQRIGVKDDGLENLGVLIDSSLKLIRTSAQPNPDVARAVTIATPRAAAPAPPAASATTPQLVAIGPPVYSIADDGVVPPVTIQQRLPAATPSLVKTMNELHNKGVLEIVIDESGHVVDVRVRQSLGPEFDAAVARSARTWKYRPALKDGIPVRFVKTIELVRPGA